MSISEQVHGKFKIFIGKREADGSIAQLARDVETFAAKAKAAPKSIGIEYVEHTKQVVVTLGYRDDEAAYPVKLDVVSLGKVPKLEGEEVAKLEQKMTQAAAKLAHVICHELFITEESEFLMVFINHQAK